MSREIGSSSTAEMALPELPGRNRLGWFRFGDAWLKRLPVWAHWLIAMILVALIGRIDATSGWQFSLFVFYVIPISFAAWWGGPVAGAAIAMLCVLAWGLAIRGDHPYDTSAALVWAMATRFFYFGVVCVAAVAVRTRQEADAARIRSLEERRQLERDIVEVSEHEQQRIGQDLHDGLCQQLAAIGCAIRALVEDLRETGHGSADDAELIEGALQRATVEARSLARGIFPVHVDRQGLAVALGDMARSMSRLTGVRIEVRESGELTLADPEAAMHLYRIAQEAVANAVRHAEADCVTLSLMSSPGRVELRVEDDGRGFDPEAEGHGKGMGLRTMRYRAQALDDCRLTVERRAGGGTRVRCVLPLSASSPTSDHQPHHEPDHDPAEGKRLQSLAGG
jgi:signal transduction histidine kinase